MSNCSNNVKNSDPTKPRITNIDVQSRRRQTITAPTRHKALRALFMREDVEWKKLSNKRLVGNVAWTIFDLWAMGHFVVEGAPVINKQPASKPITITLPSGSTIRSTHRCNLDIPCLPNHVTKAHLVPGLAHSSLISTRKSCAVGYRVAFDEEECRVYYNGKLVLVGGRCPITDLWQLPINPISPEEKEPAQHLNLVIASKQTMHTAAISLNTLPYKNNK